MPARTLPEQQRELNDIEKNVIWYAAGFVLRKLRRKYNADKSEAASKVLACVMRMLRDPTDLDQEDVDSDFERYTRVWLTKTDRCGLLHVTDYFVGLRWLFVTN